MINITSNKFGVTGSHIEKELITSPTVDSFVLDFINIVGVGRGAYLIEAHCKIDEIEYKIKRRTTNSQLYDAWRSGMSELYEDGDDGFENWDDVVSSMLMIIDFEEVICDHVYDREI